MINATKGVAQAQAKKAANQKRHARSRRNKRGKKERAKAETKEALRQLRRAQLLVRLTRLIAEKKQQRSTQIAKGHRYKRYQPKARRAGNAVFTVAIDGHTTIGRQTKWLPRINARSKGARRVKDDEDSPGIMLSCCGSDSDMEGEDQPGDKEIGWEGTATMERGSTTALKNKS